MNKNNLKIPYTTSLNSELVKKFKVYCVLKGKYQNEVLEKLLEEFLEKEGGINGNTNK